MLERVIRWNGKLLNRQETDFLFPFPVMVSLKFEYEAQRTPSETQSTQRRDLRGP
jgi:hypothetical protein